MNYNIAPELKSVSATLLVPLFYRAKETLENGIIRDDAAIDIVRNINYDFHRISDDMIAQRLVAIRTKFIDDIVFDYIKDNPAPVIINLGAGLDTRHLKFDNGITWYQLDLEKAISLRKHFFGNEHNNITKSILDFSWIDDIAERSNVLFIIEGVLMYLDEEQVRSVFMEIGKKFSDSIIVFDTIPASLIGNHVLKSIDNKSAPFKWSNTDSSDIEAWKYGFTKYCAFHYISEESSNRIYSGYTSLQDTGYKVRVMNINQNN